MLTLAHRYPSALISLEEDRALFDQGHTLLEPTIHHHEVLFDAAPEKLQILANPSRYPTRTVVLDLFQPKISPLLSFSGM